MIELGDVLRSVRELKNYSLTMAARRATAAFNDGYLMGHVGVHGVVGDRIDPRMGHDLTRLVHLRHAVLLKVIDEF